VTSNYIIFVAAKEENVYVCARSTQYCTINCHYYHDCEHFMYVWNSLWTQPSLNQILCVTQNCIITELNRQQVKEHLPVFPQKHQSIVHWICLCCAKITAALFIKRLIIVTWFCCLGSLSSLLSDGILILVWKWYKCIRY